MSRTDSLERERRAALPHGDSAQALVEKPALDVTMDGLKGLIWFGVGVMFALSI